jgi:hypothetical protein
MGKKNITPSTRNWEARDDAWTLGKAKEITADKARLAKAKVEAGKILLEKQKELKSIKAVAKVTKKK